MRHHVLSCVLGTLIVLAAGACGPTGQQLAVPGAGGSIAPRTALTHNEASHNALSAGALWANRELRAALATNALNSDAVARAITKIEPLEGTSIPSDYTGDPAHYYQDMTQELMTYIASCALAPSRKISAGNTTYSGELGLCDEWFDELPSIECQQIVSSCVLARVNALQHRVVISLHGSIDTLFPLQQSVAVETELRDKTSITSLSTSCEGVSAAVGETRNCDWKPLYVGRCTPGETVTVCAGGGAADAGPDCGCGTSTGARPMVRVCKGLYGCDDPNGAPAAASYFNETDPTTPSSYAGLLAEGQACDGGNPFTFQCPANGYYPSGSTGARMGYFSVMVASADPGAGGPSEDVSVRPASSVRYPASEADVFTYPEGAFFGNILSPTPLEPDTMELAQSDVGLSLYGDLYACYSDEWNCSMAHMTDRFCAGAGSAQAQPCPDSAAHTACFGNEPGQCSSHDRTVVHCDSLQDAAGSPYYQSCHPENGTGLYLVPITVYLNHPCDLAEINPDGSCLGYQNIPTPP